VIQNNPALKKRFRKATEHRGITTADGGSRYDVKASKEAALQGIPISLCLFDELHLAKPGMWSAAILGTSQRKDGIVIGITTAGDENSATLLDLYKNGQAAIDGDPNLERFGFFCWEAPTGAGVTDPDAIMAANPSVAAGRIPISQIIADLQTIPEHEARRYRLNQFISGSVQSWLPNAMFRAAAGTGISNIQGAVLAVDKTKNWEHATIAAANQNGDITETELVSSLIAPTEERLYQELVSLYHAHNIRAIALDDRSLPNLGKRLKQNGIPVWQLWTKEVAAACSTVYAMFTNETITWNASDHLLIAQVPNGVTKYLGESWLISRKDSSGDIDALMATLFASYVSTVARHAAIGVF